MRIATFNVENLDDKPGSRNPDLATRSPVLRKALNRLNADILCLQEVHGQELPEHTSNDPARDFAALDQVLAGTRYASFSRVSTLTTDGVPYNERNLLVLADPSITMLPVKQYKNSLINKLQYRKITASPAETEAKDVTWERPILHARLETPEYGLIHIINLHLKSRLASNVTGQKNGFQWNSAAGWAEGYFLSSMKRVGQALETRIVIDGIFDSEPDAKILVCGDFNGEPGEVPVEAICGRVENTDNADLSGRVLVPCSRGIAASVRYTHLHHGEPNLLDHMMISQSLLPHFRQAEIHNENLHDESMPFAFDTKFPESDHAPFAAEFG